MKFTEESKCLDLDILDQARLKKKLIFMPSFAFISTISRPIELEEKVSDVVDYLP